VQKKHINVKGELVYAKIGKPAQHAQSGRECHYSAEQCLFGLLHNKNNNNNDDDNDNNA